MADLLDLPAFQWRNSYGPRAGLAQMHSSQFCRSSTTWVREQLIYGLDAAVEGIGRGVCDPFKKVGQEAGQAMLEHPRDLDDRL